MNVLNFSRKFFFFVENFIKYEGASEFKFKMLWEFRGVEEARGCVCGVQYTRYIAGVWYKHNLGVCTGVVD